MEETVKESEVPEKQETDEKGKVEELAKELGWRDDFDGDEFVDAKSYILKGKDIQATMKNHIKEQKKQLTDLSGSVQQLQTHNEMVFKAEVKRLESELSTLKKEKKEAIEDGDVDKVDQLDEQIDGVKEAMIEPQKTSNPDFDKWVAKNEWYTNDTEMAAYADTIADQNAGAPFSRVSVLVTRKVKEMYPDKFEDNPKPKASPVEGATRKTTKVKFTKADLTDEQRMIAKQFAQQGIMTESQYIKDIAKIQGAA